MLRQGDVLIRRVRRIPAGATPVQRDRGRVVLAYGESTGHAHAIAEDEAEMLQTEEARFLRVLAEGGVSLIHEEHATITVPPGEYEVVLQREYTPEAIRRVSD